MATKATKGVLGNDPFQRGAAQRTAETGDAKEAPKAAAPKLKASAAKGATRAKKAAEPQAAKAKKKAKAPKAAAPMEGVAEPVVSLREPAAPAEIRLPDEPERSLPPPPPIFLPVTSEEEGELVVDEEAMRAAMAAWSGLDEESEPTEPRPSGFWPAVVEPPAEEQAAPQERVAVDDSAFAAALREIEEAMDQHPSSPYEAVPGFEAEWQDVSEPAAPAAQEPFFVGQPGTAEAAEVLRATRTVELSEQEAAAYALSEKPLVEGTPPESAEGTPHEPFFTDQSPGAESHSFAHQASKMLGLAKEIAFQAVASEGVTRALSSFQGLRGAALTGLGVGGSTSIDEYGKDTALVGVLRPVLDFFYERYWRVSVQGASHVPAGPVILVANHAGALPVDGPVLQLALARERPDLQEARWLVEDQVFYAPMLGTLMNRLGAVRACPENAARLLNELRPVIVFPEGIQGLSKPFAQRYQLKRFGRGGFVKLAMRTGAPIVPVAVVGAEETAPLLGKIPASVLGVPYLPVTPPPLPARWLIRFGEPLALEGYAPKAAEDLSQVQRITERVRESIQGMLLALLKERRTVFGG
jgi:1-acyl-sn-glycerol-3-phosphate acyltransferase